MDLNKLVNTPEWILVVVMTGYLAYVVANMGMPKTKHPKETLIYQVLVYGFIGSSIFDLLRPHVDWYGFAAFPALLTTLIFATLWRKWVRDFVYRFMRFAKVTNEDGRGDVWNTLIENTKISVSEVNIYLNSGMVLRCDDVSKFLEAPIPLLMWDEYGNIAIYVTHFKRNGEESFQEEIPHFIRSGDGVDHDSAILTYIPATNIDFVDFRVTEPV